MAGSEVRAPTRVMTRCEADGAEVFTGHRMRPADITALREPRSFRCSRCAQIHSWTADVAWCEERAIR